MMIIDFIQKDGPAMTCDKDKHSNPVSLDLK
jgi:hypothetical protein